MPGQTRPAAEQAAAGKAAPRNGDPAEGKAAVKNGETAGTGTAGGATDRAAPSATPGPVRMAVPGMPGLVPDPKRLLWWGGLAALAALEVIEWPVAVVVAAGSYVAERMARQDVRRDSERQS
jgi:hypothetical protein